MTDEDNEVIVELTCYRIRLELQVRVFLCAGPTRVGPLLRPLQAEHFRPHCSNLVHFPRPGLPLHCSIQGLPRNVGGRPAFAFGTGGHLRNCVRVRVRFPPFLLKGLQFFKSYGLYISSYFLHISSYFPHIS